MKILQNPIAVTILALVAVAMLFYQIVWPMMQHSHGVQPAPAVASSTVPAPKAASQPGPGHSAPALAVAVNAMPEMKIDGGAAGASAARVAESPRRDPFQGQLLAVNPTKPYPAARELLSFQGLWQQSGSTLAVINNRIIAVGDSILEFKVESMDHDRVWVEGPNGRESVEFGAGHASSQAGARTNSTPPAKPDK